MIEKGIVLAEVRRRMDAEEASLFEKRKQHAAKLLASLAGQLILEKGRAVGHAAITLNANEVYQRHGLPTTFFNHYDLEEFKESLRRWSRSVGYSVKIEYQNPNAWPYSWAATLTPAV